MAAAAQCRLTAGGPGSTCCTKGSLPRTHTRSHQVQIRKCRFQPLERGLLLWRHGYGRLVNRSALACRGQLRAVHAALPAWQASCEPIEWLHLSRQEQDQLIIQQQTAIHNAEGAVSPIRFAVMTSADYHASDLQRATFSGLPCVSDIPACVQQSPSRSPCHPVGLWSPRQPRQPKPASPIEATSAASPVGPAVQASVAVPAKASAWRVPAETQVVWLVGLIAASVISGIIALLVNAIPALRAMTAAARSAERLADTAREELPATMAAMRLSGMEISDLTMELSDLSQDISEGIRSSTRAMRAAEDGLKRVGNFAANQTLTVLQERASMSRKSVQPAVAQAAASTREAVAQARRLVKDMAALQSLKGWVKRPSVVRAPPAVSQGAAAAAAEAAAQAASAGVERKH